MRPCTPD